MHIQESKVRTINSEVQYHTREVVYAYDIFAPIGLSEGHSFRKRSKKSQDL